MKLFHLSDLHIGKLLCGYSLKENQERVLSRIVAYAQEEHPDAILICGDIYDKSAPSGEAYVMFDRFLEALSEISPRIRFSSSRAIMIPRNDCPMPPPFWKSTASICPCSRPSGRMNI